MKRYTYPVAMTAFIIASITFTSCQTPAQKEETAKDNVQDAKEQLKEAKQEVNAEYPSFRKEEEIQIAENETRITEIRAKLSNSGKAPLDGLRKKRIDDLEAQNAELRSRLYGYETQHTDWVTFKVGFKRDMDKLHNAFSDFGKDLKK